MSKRATQGSERGNKEMRIIAMAVLGLFSVVVIYFGFSIYSMNNGNVSTDVNADIAELLKKNPILEVASDYKGHWAESEIMTAVGNGILNGTTPSTLEPDGVVTRSLFVTMLKRMDGGVLPTQTGKTMPFVDVQEDVWLSQAVEWAWSNGIANGVSATLFYPNHIITREEMLVMLNNYIVAKGETLSVGEASQQLDISKCVLDSWAREAVEVLNTSGLLHFYTENSLTCDFTETATRAELSVLLVNYLNKNTL